MIEILGIKITPKDGIICCVILGVSGIIAHNFQYLLGLVSMIDGDTTITFNLHTTFILVLFTWVGLIQLHLIRKKDKSVSSLNP